MKGSSSRKTRNTLLILTCLVGLYVGVQILVAYQYATMSTKTERQFESIETTTIEDHKKLEEAIALRIENSRKKLFWATFVSNISATIGVLAALVGIWMGFRQYLQAYEKQQQEQARERKDRIAMDLSELWRSVTSDKPAERAGCVAALQDLLSVDKTDFHKRAVSALALMSRMHKSDQVLQNTLVPVVEECFRKVSREVITAVSWQHTRLYKADFSHTSLAGIDFRDAFLEDVDFSHADLTGARMDAAKLNGAVFDQARLDDVVLRHADMAGASFKNASLIGADLDSVLLLDADLLKADLIGTETSWATLDITQAKNWRTAKMASSTYKHLLSVYGEGPKAPRVLMIMWEMEPVVSGGGWTAVYHLVKKLCRQGVDLTLMIPWMDSPVSRGIFGNEVNLIPVGIDFDQQKTDHSVDQPQTFGQQWVESSIYSVSAYYSYQGVYTKSKSPEISQTELVNRFTQKALSILSSSKQSFDVVHAHDWLSFPAAKLIAEHLKVPWVAHFHSIEADRRKVPTDWIMKVESDACRWADSVVTTSDVNRKRLLSFYPSATPKASVAPNCLSDRLQSNGRITCLDPGLVLFVGRRCWQKGSDLFVYIARAVQRLRPKTRFAMIGRDASGENFLYDQGYLSWMSVESTIDLVSRSDIRKPDLYLEPVAEDEMSTRQKLIRTIRVVEYQPSGMITQVDFPENMDEQSAKEMLLSMGALLFEEGSHGSFTHLAVLSDRGAGKPPVWGFLINAPVFRNLPRLDPEEHISVQNFTPWQRRHEMFENASAVVVPSRHEPFGMQVLEAMQQGVPVFVCEQAGVNEVLKSVITIDPKRPVEVAEKIVDLLFDYQVWEKQSQAQLTEIADYSDRDYETRVLGLWKKLVNRDVDS